MNDKFNKFNDKFNIYLLTSCNTEDERVAQNIHELWIQIFCAILSSVLQEVKR